jgi:hypothetical protein
MFQHVPQIAAKVAQQHGAGAGYFVGLQLLIPRIIGSISGHMAYSGYLGYFIGLSVLKPESRWQILGIGYLTASALHALWNSVGTLGVGFHVFVGGNAARRLGGPIDEEIRRQSGSGPRRGPLGGGELGTGAGETVDRRYPGREA